MRLGRSRQGIDDGAVLLLAAASPREGVDLIFAEVKRVAIEGENALFFLNNISNYVGRCGGEKGKGKLTIGE